MAHEPKFTQEEFKVAMDLCMGIGAALQRVKPGVLDDMALMIEHDLNNAKSLMLTPIKRRRGEKMMKMLRASETFRAACADLALTMDLVDPEDKTQ